MRGRGTKPTPRREDSSRGKVARLFPVYGEGRTRTGDTPVFSRVLYQLSYLAPVPRYGGPQSIRTAEAPPPPRGVRRAAPPARPSCAPRPRPPPCPPPVARGIAGQRDQAEARMVLAQPRNGSHAVDERHVEVDHDCIRIELVRELDGVEAVLGGADDGELGLMLDQRPQGFQKHVVVVRQEDANGCRSHPFRLVGQGPDVSLAAGCAQPAERQVALIGSPLDLRAGRAGVDLGPSAIRYAGIAEHLTQKLGMETDDLGNVEAPVAESTLQGDDQARYLPQILELCDRVARLVAQVRREGKTPIVLGGDHSVALGSLVGMASVSGPGGVIWVDAHGDLNTPESSPSGNVHGMVLAAALGLGGAPFAREGWTLPAIESGKLALVGVRSLDDGERQQLSRLDAKV